jgi:hypothetical protein
MVQRSSPKIDIEAGGTSDEFCNGELALASGKNSQIYA